MTHLADDAYAIRILDALSDDCPPPVRQHDGVHLDYSLAITHDGKTVWVGGGDTVTPISTATNTPGKPIKIIGASIATIAVTP